MFSSGLITIHHLLEKQYASARKKTGVLLIMSTRIALAASFLPFQFCWRLEAKRPNTSVGMILRGTSALSTLRVLQIALMATWGRSSSCLAWLADLHLDGYLQRPCGWWILFQVPHGLAGVTSPIAHLSDNSPCSFTSCRTSRLDPE